MTSSDNWLFLQKFTKARIALGRRGVSLPTQEVLNFGLAHAQAKDAIYHPFESEKLEEQIAELGLTCLTVHSCAKDREQYLCRPDLGRKLSEESKSVLQNSDQAPADLVIVIGDGLSSYAVHRQSIGLITALLPYLSELGIRVGPVVLAHQSRVALGDQIGEYLKAKAVVVFIGERPGLSSPDSLGVYMTWAPNAQRIESERNCISNVRPEGLGYKEAAFKLAWLLEQSFKRKMSGVLLKDESDMTTLHYKGKPSFPSLG